VETTVSEVENFLLPSPLVTGTGLIVVATDDCSVNLLPDPANLAAGTPWVPRSGYSGKWTAPSHVDGAMGDCVPGGMALDNTNGIYFLDYRNEIVYKLDYTLTGFSPVPLVWNATFKGNPLTLDLDTSMLFIPGANVGDTGILWVPLGTSLLGNSGLAAIVSPLDGTYTFVPKGDADCRPTDYGSAATSGQDIVLLGDTQCGASHLDGSGLPPKRLWGTYPLYGKLLFDMGVHSHPVFDSGTQNLFFIDWANDMLIRQQLYCFSLTTYQECAGWATQNTRIPELDILSDPTGDLYDRWQWLAAGLAGNYVYVAASSPKNDEVIDPNGRADLISALYVWNTATGLLIAQYRFNGDLFNSAPLIVQGTVGAPRIFLMSALGTLYCFGAAEAVANGPLWTTPNAVAGIPDDDLPQSTFAYMSLTATGTILVVGSAGGKDWADEKVYSAIVNGVFNPTAAPPMGETPAQTAGIAVGIVVVIGAAFAGAYFKVPAFTSAVNAAANSASKAVAKTGLLGGTGSGYSPSESKGLLASGGAYGSTAPSFTGTAL